MNIISSFSRRRLARLNRRQRKKLCVGEFQQVGCWIELSFTQPLDEQGLDQLLEAAEGLTSPLGVQLGGLGGALPLSQTEAFLGGVNGQSVTQEERDAMLAGLKALPQVAQVRVSDWIDVWHPGTVPASLQTV
ncbi:50S ribosome-binding protein YggL [Roseateles sp. BYS87W]|uniref:50S ribosome-binding protein YggL n=1 Tax=Pelomonas baiyunensis TaxID=3299026 RepID=A0ABW7H3X9_9BURK